MGIAMGKFVECKVTGFKGIVVSLTQYITGCDRAGVQPRCGSDGKYEDCKFFDVGQLRLVPGGVGVDPTELVEQAGSVDSPKTGGPRPAPPSR